MVNNIEGFDVEALKRLVDELSRKIASQAELIKQLQQEQESLAEWVRGLEQVIRVLPMQQNDNEKVTGRYNFSHCTVNISEK